MNHYCTLFDSNYLTRGLALHASLLDVGEEFTLYIFCFDDRAYRMLEALQLPHTVTVSMEEFETPALREVRPTRSRAEYCWTCTPHVIRHALETFSLDSVTYLDADLFFYQRPSILLEELRRADGSVLLTGHNYSPRYRKLLRAGKYCVQFMTFRSDERGREALSWWQERCLEWCYDRLEENRFGDQKYLDDWTERFPGVHVLEHPGGGIAPWNVQGYRISLHGDRPYAVDPERGIEFPVVFYHFHHLRFYDNGFMELGHYDLNKDVKRALYTPYVERLFECRLRVGLTDPSFDPNGPVAPAKGVVKALGRLQRRLKGNYFRIQEYRSF